MNVGHVQSRMDYTTYANLLALLAGNTEPVDSYGQFYFYLNYVYDKCCWIDGTNFGCCMQHEFTMPDPHFIIQLLTVHTSSTVPTNRRL